MNITNVKDAKARLRRKFKTEKIYFTTANELITDDEIETIVKLIKTEREDGEYVVSEDFVLVLAQGKALILDNIDA